MMIKILMKTTMSKKVLTKMIKMVLKAVLTLIMMNTEEADKDDHHNLSRS